MGIEHLRLLLDDNSIAAIDEYDFDDDSERMAFAEQFLVGANNHADAATAFRAILVGQIADGTPPEASATVQRLHDQGVARERIVNQMTIVLATAMQKSLDAGDRFDEQLYTDALADLPLPDFDDILNQAIDTVRSSPGIHLDELDAHLATTLPQPPSDAARDVIGLSLDMALDRELWLSEDDRVFDVRTLIDGVTLCQELDESLIEIDVLTAAPNLMPFDRCDTLRLPSGEELHAFSVDTHHRAWGGPEGWLAEFGPDNTLAVSLTIVDSPPPGLEDAHYRPHALHGVVTLAVTDPLEPSPEVLEVIREAYKRSAGEPELPVSGDDVLFGVLATDRPILTQTPLTAVCEAAGLDVYAGRIASSDTVWRRDRHHEWRRIVEAEVPEPRWRRIAMDALVVLDDPDATTDEIRRALDAIAEPEVIDVVVDVLVPSSLDEKYVDEIEVFDAPGHLFARTEQALTAARRPRETASAEYLAAVLWERTARPLRAERHLRNADRAHPRLGSVVERLGWYAFDRGEAREAMKWWNTLSEPHEAAQVLAPFLGSAAATPLGRNAPCWCGSGRKFKQCHLGEAERPPLPDRVGWLARKATTWLEHSTGTARELVVGCAIAYVAGEPDEDALSESGATDADLGAAFEDPIVIDAALTEGRLFSRFLHERGELLPEDERLLAASWLTTERSVHEIIDVQPGSGIVAKDLATGDVVDVRERAASQEMQVGERWCARIVPDGAGHQIVGGIFPVTAGTESHLLEVCDRRDPFEICAWAGERLLPPSVEFRPGMASEMIDSGALEAVIAELGEDASNEDAMDAINIELRRQMQARWVDEEVPALGGLTPREAAVDPTRREDLIRLLDEFEDRAHAMVDGSAESGFNPFTYDVPGLRRELGVESD